MNEKQILKAAYDRGKTDAQHGHPGPDAADVADLVEKMRTARGMIDVGEVDVDWTEAQWDEYRILVRQNHHAVEGAYALGFIR